MIVKFSILAATALLACVATAQDPAEQAIAVESTTTEGRALVSESVRQMAALKGIETRIRMHVRLFGHQLVGSGTYRQASAGPDKLVRLEMKLQLASGTSSFQQIRDRRFLWTRSEFPDRTRLARVDLRRVQQRAETNPPSIPSPGGPTDWISLGGLPALLSSLEQQFDFETAVADVIGTANVPVWRVEGRWLGTTQSGTAASDTVPSNTTSASTAEPVPQLVRLVLGRGEPLPLFPYRVEFLRDTPTGPAPIVTLEFFEVRRTAKPDLTLFEYEPGDQPVEDETDAFLDRLSARTGSERIGSESTGSRKAGSQAAGSQAHGSRLRVQSR